ncbi:MAG: ATP-binding cassette domain-containing protein [Methylobacter sp.]|uniref:ATP-binding cassette domain-containing protein n=1 Tax=Candidatus Methylobacter titanis TaxID=3053457 RepID=A0AA43TQQ4_9GAMM|nr:ATP-binding cassette domain-containing protein [Candidatus Methylobacter titanis]
MRALLSTLLNKGKISKGSIDPLLDIFRSPDLRRVSPLLAVAALLYNILGLILPMAILQIMDRVVLNQSLETLALLVVGVVVGLVIEELLREVNGLVTSWLGARFEHNASVEALSRLMHVPIQRLQQEEPGVHIERVASASKVAEFYSGQALLVLLDLPFVLIFLGMIYVIGGWVVLVPVVLLVIFVYVIFRFGSWLRQLVDRNHVANDRRRNYLVEVFTGIHAVKTMAMEAQMERRHERLQAGSADMSESMSNSSAMATALGTSFVQVMTVSIVFASAMAVLSGQMTPGGVAACMMLSVRSLQPLRRGLTVWIRYQGFVAAKKRLQEVNDMPCDDDHDKPELPQVQEIIELKRVGLERRHGNPILQDISFSIQAGECILIQGESGSGKSSLLSIIGGAIMADSGDILVDGRSLTEFSADSVQREIGLLPQKGALITGTILENMTMFDKNLNEAALDIAHQLGLDEAVASMKLGYETSLGEGNAETLPSGVRQIISIVRILVHKPSVLLFDEANLSLDMAGDKRLLNYISQLKGICTIVLITPRPSWFTLADRVLNIANGRIVDRAVDTHQSAQVGAGATYLERPPHVADYADLIRRQFEEESDLSICLLPLLRALGWHENERELMEAMPHAESHLDLSGLCSTMEHLGLLPRSFVSSLARIDHRLMPCLFVPMKGSVKVVLERLPDGRLRCFDSGMGGETILDASTVKNEVYVFRAPEHMDIGARNEIKFFGNLFQRFRKHIFLAFGFTVANTVFALVPPLFVKSIYDRVLPSGDITMASYLVLGVFIALVLDFQVRHLKGRLIAHVGGRIDYIIGTSVFRRVISLPTSSTGNVSVARQVGRLRNFDSLRNFFMGPLAVIAFEMPSNIIVVVAIGVINPWALLVVLISAIFFFLLAIGTRNISHRSIVRSSRTASERTEFLDEAITQMNTIRSAGCRNLWVERYRDLSGKASMANFLDNQVHARISGSAQILSTLTGFSVLAVSAINAINGDISPGSMVATIMLVWRLTGPMQNFFVAVISMSKIRTSMQQIENLMRLPTEADNGVKQTIRPESQGAISFTRTSMRYLHDSDPALLGVTFSVTPGQVVVITGPNGSGKSSILKLLTRTYLPQAGTVRLDHIDIRQLTSADLRARISYMPQHCDIFYGTIMQNLRLVYPAATDDEITWAADMAGILDDITAMPNGFQTRISHSQSSQLPIGFRQRIALARAVLKPAPIVILDEPGNGLDNMGEAALERCIEWLRGRSTLLMVSHRPAHMRMADTTIYMERGSILAIGPFESIKEKIFSRGRK